uniref:Myozenin 3a n=1 Tax=Oncorhynchus kisutch TaxID=8019 RepID=A0A8C7KR45_ONCKI
MQSAYDDLAKQRMQQSRALCSEAGRGGLNLGKKISIPKDVMMEELNLQSNRGSRMFQERLKRPLPQASPPLTKVPPTSCGRDISSEISC